MDSIMFEEPKLCVTLLCKALRPMTLKAAVEKEMKKERCKNLRSNITEFIDWLIARVGAFLMFESSLPAPPPHIGQIKNKKKRL
jgi:hypothetical protein